MAFRIVVALITALRAVLIYGEATQLATRRVELPRVKYAPRWPPAAARARRSALS